ncbi:MAG: hypothetical protein COB53_01980 [Elusimicrobia bacterium]|nr:MAG: hypothetical protein COB53_01980 [Elusimicrobiota bacterium]
MSDSRYHCRICGWRHKKPPWGLDGKTPFFTHCDCCGGEVGWQDRTVDLVKKTRANWMGRGSPWFSKGMKPEDWNRERQLEDVPKEFRD